MTLAFTEVEARNKNCCVHDKTCIASHCMAWKWKMKVDPEFIEKGGNLGWNHSFPPPPPPMINSEKGYCGLVK